MSAATHKRKSYTIKLKLEACEYAENSSNEKAAKCFTKKLLWQVGDVLIEAGSLIQAGGGEGLGLCSNRSRGLVLEVLRYLYMLHPPLAATRGTNDVSYASFNVEDRLL